MNGKYDLYIVEFLGQLTQRLVDMAHRLAEVLAAVRRDQNNALMREIDLPKHLIVKAKIIANRMMQRVDHRVARDKDAFCRNGFRKQITLRGLCRRKIEIGNAAGKLAVHFFRERRIFIVRTKPCFHMTDRYLVIISSQRAGKGRRRIAMDKNQIRLFFRQHLIQSHHRLGGNIKQGLPLRHNIQIMIRFDGKKIQHLIQHFTVLGGHGYDRRNRIRMLLKLQHDRSHLNCLRSGSKDGHHLDFLLVHSKSPFYKQRQACACLHGLIGSLSVSQSQC